MKTPPPQTKFWDIDFDEILDDYGLLVAPLPERDDDRAWCVAPYCRNDQQPRSFLCRGHHRIAARGGWTPAGLIARELVRAHRPGAGCANPACPTPAAGEPGQKTLMSERRRSFMPRRFWGGFTPGGEFLCRVCAGIVNQVANAFEPGVSPVEKAVERVAAVARADIPQFTYEKLTGQQQLRARNLQPSGLTLVDGYTLEQYITGLAQYVGFWASIADDPWVIRTRPDEAADWIASLADAGEHAVQLAIAAGELPDYSIGYEPHQITIDAMLNRFPKG